jgi:hypothetical protein
MKTSIEYADRRLPVLALDNNEVLVKSYLVANYHIDLAGSSPSADQHCIVFHSYGTGTVKLRDGLLEST